MEREREKAAEKETGKNYGQKYPIFNFKIKSY